MRLERYTRFQAGISNTGELVMDFTPSSLGGLTVEQATAAQPWVLKVWWRGSDNARWLWVEPTADAYSAGLSLVVAASRVLKHTRRTLGLDRRGRITVAA